MPDSMPDSGGLPGWFGKIPALGDFVSRRLPPDLVQAWDDWLSVEIVGARQVLGESWPGVYAAGRNWCFALAPGVLDAKRWTGVLRPSADRVGRLFPLTIAVAGDMPAPEALRQWAAMTDAALRAMDPACDAQGVDTLLASALQQGDAHAAGSALWPALDDALQRLRAGSLWWRWPESGESADPQPEACARLPRGREFLRLFD